jgi:hypothetical protein
MCSAHRPVEARLGFRPCATLVAARATASGCLRSARDQHPYRLSMYGDSACPSIELEGERTPGGVGRDDLVAQQYSGEHQADRYQCAKHALEWIHRLLAFIFVAASRRYPIRTVPRSTTRVTGCGSCGRWRLQGRLHAPTAASQSAQTEAKTTLPRMSLRFAAPSHRGGRRFEPCAAHQNPSCRSALVGRGADPAIERGPRPDPGVHQALPACFWGVRPPWLLAGH